MTTIMMCKNTGRATRVFCLVAVAVIVISEVPTHADAFFEPFASHLLAKKMMLKHKLAPPQLPQAQASFYYGGHFQQQPRPTPGYPVYGPPAPTYPAYGPQPTPGYPSYGPPSNSGYEAEPVVKPAPPLPSGCQPGTSYPPSPPPPDYANYAVHGGHGFGIYGNYGSNGNAGTYGK